MVHNGVEYALMQAMPRASISSAMPTRRKYEEYRYNRSDRHVRKSGEEGSVVAGSDCHGFAENPTLDFQAM